MPLEHRDQAIAHGDRIAPAYAAAGSPVTAKMLKNAPGQSETIRQAGVFSTAQYSPRGLSDPPPKKRVKQLCAFPDKPCRAYATTTTYCVFHNQTMRARGDLAPE
jgi:hypothetical protein